MSRVKAATDAKDYDLAIKLLDAIIEIKPDYIEAWNQRATVYYLKEGLRPFARRHPRGAGARAAPLRRAGPGSASSCRTSATTSTRSKPIARRSAIDPHLEHIPDVVKTLTEKVEGRDI